MGLVLKGLCACYSKITTVIKNWRSNEFCADDVESHENLTIPSLYYGGQFMNGIYDDGAPTQVTEILRKMTKVNEFSIKKVVSSYVNIKKSTLSITKRNESNAYDISFYFDALSPCTIQVIYFAKEVFKDKTLIFNSVNEKKKLVLPGYLDEAGYSNANYYTAGLNQFFKTDALNALYLNRFDESLVDFSGDDACRLESIIKQISIEKFDQSSERFNARTENPFIQIDTAQDDEELLSIKQTSSSEATDKEELLSEEELDHDSFKHVVIIIESLPSIEQFLNKKVSSADVISFTNNKVSTQISFAALETLDNSLELKIYKQKIIVNRFLYDSYDIYGLDKQPETSSKDAVSGKYLKKIECVICLTKEIEILIIPCRHLCLCENCVNEFYFRNENCPICRRKLSSLIKLETFPKSQEIKLA